MVCQIVNRVKENRIVLLVEIAQSSVAMAHRSTWMEIERYSKHRSLVHEPSPLYWRGNAVSLFLLYYKNGLLLCSHLNRIVTKGTKVHFIFASDFPCAHAWSSPCDRGLGSRLHRSLQRIPSRNSVLLTYGVILIKHFQLIQFTE